MEPVDVVLVHCDGELDGPCRRGVCGDEAHRGRLQLTTDNEVPAIVSRPTKCGGKNGKEKQHSCEHIKGKEREGRKEAGKLEEEERNV